MVQSEPQRGTKRGSNSVVRSQGMAKGVRPRRTGKMQEKKKKAIQGYRVNS